MRNYTTDPSQNSCQIINQLISNALQNITLRFFVEIPIIRQAFRNPHGTHGDYPLIPVGELSLNRNPANYFAEVEQAAYGRGIVNAFRISLEEVRDYEDEGAGV